MLLTLLNILLQCTHDLQIRGKRVWDILESNGIINLILESSKDEDRIVQNIVAWMYFGLTVNSLIAPTSFTKVGLTKANLELYEK